MRRLNRLKRMTTKDSGGDGGTSIPWYLAGGIDPTSVIAAYSSNASSYAASKTNLINPGTYDLDDTGHNTIGWTAAEWTFGAAGYFDTGVTLPAGLFTIVIKYSFWGDGYIFGCRPANSTGCVKIRKSIGTKLELAVRGFGDVSTYETMPAVGTIAWSPNNPNKLFIDGAPVATGAMYPGLGANSISNFLGALNSIPDGPLTSTMKLTRCAIYNTALTDAQLAAVSNP